MNIFDTYEHLIRFELERMVSAGDLPPADFARVCVEPPRNPTYGDLCTNAALVSPATDKASLAQTLARHFVSLHDVTSAEASENGFINLKLKPIVWHRAISGILHGAANVDMWNGITYDQAHDWSANDQSFNMNHARAVCRAILNEGQTVLARRISDDVLAAAPIERLTSDPEKYLIRKIVFWHHAKRGDCRVRDLYAHELSQAFRDVCNSQSGEAAMGFVSTNDVSLSLARLALARATAIVLAECAA